MVNFTGATGAIATATAFASPEDENNNTKGTASNVPNKNKPQFSDTTETRVPKLQSHLIDCPRCGKTLEIYSEDTLGHLIVICSSIIQKECALVAPFILDMILSVTR